MELKDLDLRKLDKKNSRLISVSIGGFFILSAIGMAVNNEIQNFIHTAISQANVDPFPQEFQKAFYSLFSVCMPILAVLGTLFVLFGVALDILGQNRMKIFFLLWFLLNYWIGFYWYNIYKNENNLLSMFFNLNVDQAKLIEIAHSVEITGCFLMVIILNIPMFFILKFLKKDYSGINIIEEF